MMIGFGDINSKSEQEIRKKQILYINRVKSILNYTARKKMFLSQLTFFPFLIILWPASPAEC